MREIKRGQKVNEGRNDLPAGWVWTKLGNICTKPQYGWTTKANPKGSGVKLLRTSDISSSQIAWNTVPFCTNEPDDIERYRLRKGDIIISRAGSVGISKEIDDCPAAIFASYLIRFRAISPIPSRFISLYLQSPSYWNAISEKTAGITIPNVNATKLGALRIPLPSLNEQHRIVQKIEALFERLNRAKEALNEIPPIIKKFRQSVLTKAFSGELTEQDPSDESASVLLERIRQERRKQAELEAKKKGKKVKYNKEPEPIDTSGLPDLPQGWVIAILGEILEILQYGTSVKADATSETGIPILRMGNIQDGAINYINLKHINPKKENIEKYLLNKGDILINRTNSPELVGKAGLFKKNDSYVFASYLIRLRSLDNVAISDYVVEWINSVYGKKHVIKTKHQVAGQANINSQDIRSMPLLLPPINEQCRIVKKIEELFARADVIEKAVKIAQARCEKMTQSILAKAFRGELVEQDLNDEPASELLKRIEKKRKR